MTQQRRGNRGGPGVLQNVYRCAGDDDWIALTVRTDAEWELWRSWSDSARDRDDDYLQEWFAAQELDDVVERFADAGVPVAAVVSPSVVTENPQLRHRGFFERLEHPRTGPGWYPVSAVRAACRHAAVAVAPGPDPGPTQHGGAHRDMRADRARPRTAGRERGDRHPPEESLTASRNVCSCVCSREWGLDEYPGSL